jgi:glycosyltransferase involved in cell wall biosynthesis
MLDSIHIANWLDRIQHLDAEIILFPSRRYRKINSKLSSLAQRKPESIKISNILPNRILSPYFEFLFEKVFNSLTGRSFRAIWLKNILRIHNPKFIHAIEIQSAGYLLLDAHMRKESLRNIIITNWGSDIFYYQGIEEDYLKIRKVLELADYYSAECLRDYKLAEKFGFKGTNLPLIPNSASFDQGEIEETLEPKAREKRILVKCYGGNFGLPNETVEAISCFLEKHEDYCAHLYSVTPDIINIVENLRTQFPNRITFSTVKRPISNKNIRILFKSSRIYLGMSKSDGLSTSFLEALALGAYPIQTGTSCANEWVNLGANASIIEGTAAAAKIALEGALGQIELGLFFEKNRLIAIEHLLNSRISRIAENFYS